VDAPFKPSAGLGGYKMSFFQAIRQMTCSCPSCTEPSTPSVIGDSSKSDIVRSQKGCPARAGSISPVLTLFQSVWGTAMCRNIRTLFNFDPPVTNDEIRAASLQFVRKISGFTKPSKSNEAAFQAAIEEVAEVAARLLRSLETTAPPKNREEEAAKAKARAAVRFGD